MALGDILGGQKKWEVLSDRLELLYDKAIETVTDESGLFANPVKINGIYFEPYELATEALSYQKLPKTLFRRMNGIRITTEDHANQGIVLSPQRSDNEWGYAARMIVLEDDQYRIVASRNKEFISLVDFIEQRITEQSIAQEMSMEVAA